MAFSKNRKRQFDDYDVIRRSRLSAAALEKQDKDIRRAAGKAARTTLEKKSKQKRSRIKRVRDCRVYNHSDTPLYIIENTTANGPWIHVLPPRYKSPVDIDADGFKRTDGRAILGHRGWWKAYSYLRADVFQMGRNFVLPVSIMRPVGDSHFGEYRCAADRGTWGDKMTYVLGALRDQRGRIVGYRTGEGTMTKAEGVAEALAGRLDNVAVVSPRGRRAFLRTLRNASKQDNFSADS